MWTFHTAAVLFGVGLLTRGGLNCSFRRGRRVAGGYFMLAGAFGLSRSYGRGDIYKNMVRACAIAVVGMELTLGVWCGWAGGQMGRRSLRGSPERRPFCLPWAGPSPRLTLTERCILPSTKPRGWGASNTLISSSGGGPPIRRGDPPLLRRGYPRGDWRIRA